MMKLSFPVIPNSPLNSKSDVQVYGDICLRSNEAIHFVENACFDPAIAIYDEKYQNSQAYSAEFFQHMNRVLDILKENFPEGSTVVEVGCGKGAFLELMDADAFFSVTGFDETYDGINPKIFKRYLHHADRIDADLVVLRHVLEHITQPHQFLAMLQEVFPNASVYIEVPNYDWIVDNQAFFDITYEHVNYFSQRSLQFLFDGDVMSSGLMFGNQYQYVIADLSSLSSQFASFYDDQNLWKDIDFNVLFPKVIETIEAIESLLTEHAKLYVWGGATKGCMFLVHCHHMNRLIDKIGFVVDINPHKLGKYLPGSLVAIKSQDEFFQQANANDVLLIANPIYKNEILKKLESHNILDMRILTL